MEEVTTRKTRDFRRGAVDWRERVQPWELTKQRHNLLRKGERRWEKLNRFGSQWLQGAGAVELK